MGQVNEAMKRMRELAGVISGNRPLDDQVAKVEGEMLDWNEIDE